MAMFKLPWIVFATVATAATAANGQVSDSGPFRVNAYLCETSQYAIEFAAAVSRGEENEFAKDIVGKAAGREVCGRYIGVALVQEQRIILSGGIMYKLTALRFQEDNKIAWAAESTFAAEDRSEWHL
jgi:hypothetical protein